MAGKKLSELPDFYGKDLALEVQEYGVKTLGTHINQANDLMLIGLIQVVKQLQDEIRILRRAGGLE